MSTSGQTHSLDDLEPRAVWRNFAAICEIPHPSGHEQALIAYLRSRAEQLGLASFLDEAGNLIVRKDATAGQEGRPGIVLQAHVDMVPQANAEVPHDFLRDPIRPRVADGWVAATGTTLGADDGIGVAAMLAVMEAENLAHPALEFVFTVDEEVGLRGAAALRGGILKGTRLLNLDSEEDGHIVIGCAGGRDVTVGIAIEREPAASDVQPMKVTVRGLKGGHSGLDIALCRGNAIRILARVLRLAGSVCNQPPTIAEISGGTARNAIPREAHAVVWVDRPEAFVAALAEETQRARGEFRIADPGLTVETVPHPQAEAQVFPPERSDALLRALNGCSNGVVRTSDTLPGMPETSSNLGIVSSDRGGVTITCMVRSSVDSARDAQCGRIVDVFALMGGESSLGPAYPGWRPDAASPLVADLARIYAEVSGRPARVESLHAGLECAILGAAYPQWRMASFGPTIRGAHSPDEKVEIESVATFWRWLAAALEKI